MFVVYYFFLLIFSVFKVDNKKIIIINYGKGYWDTGKYICNELMRYDYKIYRAAKKIYKNSIPQGITFVKINSIRYLYHLATAKIWINNNRFWYWIRKRKNQFYIQTWHGCIVFKKVEAAVKNTPTLYLLSAKNDSKMANLFISNSTFWTNLYKKYFWYDGDILEYWYPKNDIIVSNNKVLIWKVKYYFWFSDSDKICLYVPTFRRDHSLNVYNIEYETVIKELKNKFKGDWKILIRLHPSVSNLADQLTGLNNYIVNATDYPDLQELLVATDFLITDYSSCIFDYALSKKPAMIYASDIEEYKKDRDFEIKLEDTPFPIATNNMELKGIINNYDIEKYKDKLNEFYNKIGLKESGESSKKIAKIISDIIESKRINLN